ncbi:MAG: HAMP domain-containing histidine kinase [Dehalococcoidales bacterium]|nr:HAMP domain-containing histidine kinase [Dehalococcoidales bacterium]
MKLTLWYLLVVGILTLFFGLIAWFLLADGLKNNIIDPWDIKEADIRILSDGSGQVMRLEDISGTMIQNPEYTITKISGTRVLSTISESEVIEILTPGGNLLFVERGMLTENGTISGDEMILYLYASKNDPSGLRLIVTTRSQQNVESILDLFKNNIILTAMITLFVAGLAGFVVIWWQIRPLKRIIDGLRSGPRGDYSQRFKVDRTDEVGELAGALNRLFEQTEQHIDGERQLTSDISHELRTPLALAQAEASLALTRDRNSEEYRIALENVSREIFRLTSLIDKLLFLARSDKNNEPDKATFKLNELLKDIVSSAEVLCELKDQMFSFTHEDECDTAEITGDFMRLRELFLNLIDNAVKYTENGGSITISVKRENSRAVISVRDTGAGIDEKYFPHIFDRFYRIGTGGAYGKAGTGLGLAICRRIVNLHDGKIFVESKPGEGSTFTVELPLALAKIDHPRENEQTKQ